MLACDLQHDFVRSCVGPLAAIEPDHLRGLVAEMVAEGAAELGAEGADDVSHQVSLDLRYLKQYHEVTVPVSRAVLDAADLAAVAAPFHDEHDRLYGYELREEGTGLELINVRVRSLGRTAKPPLPRLEPATTDVAETRKGVRRAFVPETGAFAEVPVHDGHALRPGHVLAGPALVERVDTTVLVSASYGARVDDHGTLVLEVMDA